MSSKLWENIPGVVALHVTAFPAGESPKPVAGTLAMTEHDVRKGTIAKFRRYLGGKSEGFLIDPFLGNRHYVSLKEVEHLSSETPLVLKYTWKPSSHAHRQRNG
jgi:hypothetical protein